MPPRPSRAVVLPVRALSVAAALLLTACGSTPGSIGSGGPATGRSTGQQTITVFAAASLTDVGPRLAAAYRASHPGIEVRFNLAGSQALVSQLIAGADADVLLTADRQSLTPLMGTGILAGDPTVVAVNHLVLAVDPAAGIRGLADLARSGVRTAICQSAVPCGRVSRQVLERAGVIPSATTEEENVRGALTKLTSGQVQAALVYRTDATSAGSAVRIIDLPAAGGNPYPIALTRTGATRPEAAAFERWLTGPEARAVFAAAGFDAPS
ncbi:molybdate ABC transporter substrate-binding protein [Tersicoccus phoenicis]|uniref:Molybdate ABC transporter substrate-binding protein n=1 Tax=Tersicoccus phoenicis TaxID=554083 RepID=A0A1R1LB74_9MICC|nr:molybdate ABC transporter substrate-binding protein [Tersicoccus phoenicis]OMH24785.1 molybdate ABC transporter substrate-binding protein [Tersicoccus phoenicis]